MTDFDEEEIHAIEETFPGMRSNFEVIQSLDAFCYFHETNLGVSYTRYLHQTLNECGGIDP